MEPWQYSNIHSKFVLLQQQLTNGSVMSKQSSNNNEQVAQVESMMIDGPGVKLGMKRKAEDMPHYLQDAGLCQSKSRAPSKSTLLLDVYTQTDESAVCSQDKALAKISQELLSNQSRLDGIERLLGVLHEKISLLVAPNNNVQEQKRVVERQGHRNSLSPESLPRSPQTAHALNSPPANRTIEAPSLSPGLPGSAAQSTANGWSQGMGESAGELKSPLEVNIQDVEPNTSVPLIICSGDHPSHSMTMNVPVTDLINGNVTLPGGESVSVMRGCWLGNRLDPNSRVWYCGDPKPLMQAEISGGNPAKLSLNLLEALFTRSEMAASNVSGARGHNVLDPIKITAIQAHVNYKFPLSSEKQELRWQLLKPRIDSKCRAQRRIQKEQGACTTDQSGAGSAFTRRNRRASRTPRVNISTDVKNELLYGSSAKFPAREERSEVVVEGTEDGDQETNALYTQNALGFASSTLQQHQ